MSEIKYLEYRRYLGQRQAVNSAIMALLAGSKLAANTLSLTEGSTSVLGDIFPRVRHIERFNLKSEVARRILDDAEAHLGSMALPYILAIHEDLLGNVLDLLVEARLLSKTQRRKATPSTMHESAAIATGAALDIPGLQLFHVIREMRNCIIHSAGVADDDLLGRLSEVGAAGSALWTRFTSKSLPKPKLGKAFALGHDEIVVALAVTKHLARELNMALAVSYPRHLWVARAVADAHQAGRTSGNPNQSARSVAGYARLLYGPIGISKAEVEVELRVQNVIST